MEHKYRQLRPPISEAAEKDSAPLAVQAASREKERLAMDGDFRVGMGPMASYMSNGTDAFDTTILIA